MNFKKNKSSKKSISITALMIIAFVAIMAAIASIGIIKVNSNISAATAKAVIFKDDGKIYSFNFDKEIKQIKYEKTKKPVVDTSKFNTLPVLANKVNVIGDNDFCIFQLTDDDGQNTINFIRPDGSFYTFEMEQLILESAILSEDKTTILIRNKAGVLYIITLKNNEVDKYTMVDENVTEAFFTGLKNDIVYMKGKDFYYSSGGYKSEIEKNIEKIAISTDSMSVYYTKNDLTLVKFDVGKTKILDSNVYNIVYCGGGKLAYIKDYSTVNGNGNLFYVDGEKVIDVGVKVQGFLE